MEIARGVGTLPSPGTGWKGSEGRGTMVADSCSVAAGTSRAHPLAVLLRLTGAITLTPDLIASSPDMTPGKPSYSAYPNQHAQSPVSLTYAWLHFWFLFCYATRYGLTIMITLYRLRYRRFCCRLLAGPGPLASVSAVHSLVAVLCVSV